MWLMKNCNPEVDFAELRMNQKLMVPQIEKSSAEEPDDDPPQEQELDGTSAPMETVTEGSTGDPRAPAGPIADQTAL